MTTPSEPQTEAAPKLAQRVVRLVDIYLRLTPDVPHYPWDTDESYAKQLEEWGRDLEAFLRDHRSQERPRQCCPCRRPPYRPAHPGHPEGDEVTTEPLRCGQCDADLTEDIVGRCRAAVEAERERLRIILNDHPPYSAYGASYEIECAGSSCDSTQYEEHILALLAPETPK